MASNINEYLESLLKDTKSFAGDELKKYINDAKDDNRIFIKHIGELTEEFIKMRALGKITNDEFKELMTDLLDLNKIYFLQLRVDFNRNNLLGNYLLFQLKKDAHIITILNYPKKTDY